MGLFQAKKGTRTNYNAITNHTNDSDVLYVCHGSNTHANGLFVGGDKVAVDGELSETSGVITINIDGVTKQTYTTTQINSMITSGIIWKGDISVANLKLVTNYKVGWLYRINSTTGNPWATNVNLEIGDYILCISDYNSAFSTNDFVVWERNLTGAITNYNGINGWTNGIFNPIVSIGGAGANTVTEVASPVSNTGNLFLKYFDDGQSTPTPQSPEWTVAVEPYNYPTDKLGNNKIILGAGEAKVKAMGSYGTAGNILISGGNNNPPSWLGNPSTNNYVLAWNSSTGLPNWVAPATIAGSGDGNNTYDLQNGDDSGYVKMEEFDTTQNPAVSTGVDQINVFDSLTGNEGILIYDPTFQQSFNIGSNPAMGKTWKIDIPATNGLLYFNARVTTGTPANPSLDVKGIVTTLNSAHTGTAAGNGGDILTEGAVVNALLWGSF